MRDEHTITRSPMPPLAQHEQCSETNSSIARVSAVTTASRAVTVVRPSPSSTRRRRPRRRLCSGWSVSSARCDSAPLDPPRHALPQPHAKLLCRPGPSFPLSAASSSSSVVTRRRRARPSSSKRGVRRFLVEAFLTSSFSTTMAYEQTSRENGSLAKRVVD